ncbi:arylesterase [Limibaculum sp. M0105]|uniref:Arylesterase n=1 Tax=Thermohalobaculum xanthum TaxID=2753746 RepID=A0A8J7MAC3_9RHOB|nr:arylesterase [Thermohalobaculum xanthum]MBK0401138.1 arylesterase [Thermohalobaculum xanthum]
MISIPRRLTGSYGPRGAWRKHFAGLALCFLALFLARPADAGPATGPRIVAIGDSLTAGYGLPPTEGFVPQLDAWLAENGHPQAEVVNMGVSGDTTAGGRARLDWALGDGADAVIIALGGNDMLRGIAPESSRANLEAMLEDLVQRGLPVLLAGMQAPLNYGPDYKADFDAMYPELAARHGALLHPFFLEGLVGERELFQEDGLHPNAEGVARMVEAIGPRVIELIGRTGP